MDLNNNQKVSKDLGVCYTVTTLPVLFANGFPISLEEMAINQLEMFIPFLVKCSLNLNIDEEPNIRPEWWPSTLNFVFPLKKSQETEENWKNLLKNLVVKCYSFHNQPYLLEFSKRLSSFDRSNIRYVKISERSTAMYSRNPDRLLVTFQNVLMQYDKKKDELCQNNQIRGKQATLKIFLCDNCDLNFLSEEVYNEHEKTCNKTESREPLSNIIESSNTAVNNEEKLQNEQRNFLANFNLVHINSELLLKRNDSWERRLRPKKEMSYCEVGDKFPFSSPLSVIAVKPIDAHYKLDKLRTLEQSCPAKPKQIYKEKRITFPRNNPEKTLMRTMRKTKRMYQWPKKQLLSKKRNENFEFLNRQHINVCKPFKIIAKKFPIKIISKYKDNTLRVEEEKNFADLISNSDTDSTEEIEGIKENPLKLNNINK